jgi:hypothetical protein
MPGAEHRIRLRGGWECHYREGDDEEAVDILRRVDLPAASLRDLPPRFRLTRQFGRPPVDPRNEDVYLEMRTVPGLRSARLNGQSIGPDPAGGRDWTITLPETLLPRNGLVLEVERDVAADDDPSPWGEIALVIRRR